MKILIEEKDESDEYRIVPVKQYIAMIEEKKDVLLVYVPNREGVMRIQFSKRNLSFVIDKRLWFQNFQSLSASETRKRLKASNFKDEILLPNLCGGETRITRFKSSIPQGNIDNLLALKQARNIPRSMDYNHWSGERCNVCSRDQRIAWAVTDEAWKRIMGDSQTVVCFECFLRFADQLKERISKEDIVFFGWVGENFKGTVLLTSDSMP